MGAIAALIPLEKLHPRGEAISQIVEVLSIGASVVLLTTPSLAIWITWQRRGDPRPERRRGRPAPPRLRDRSDASPPPPRCSGSLHRMGVTRLVQNQTFRPPTGHPMFPSTRNMMPMISRIPPR